ncbi:MAG: hypothetical protein ACUVQ6_01860 [Dissulfurimicrobium sp.]|uniref:hypothetical protein n=1 Tax=Dissulfurimicrobium sp. TaxID=2022436 RepID=UPI00404B49F8
MNPSGDNRYAQDLVKDLISQLQGLVKRPMRFMEVCGTHTVSILRSGLRSIIPEEIDLISGPGCPVCVTAQGDIDVFIEAAKRPDVTVATFGDLIRVPGTNGSLVEQRAMGADVEVVYSPMDALQPALNAMLETGSLGIDGLICPGHVSAIIGAAAYRPVANVFRMPCVVAGFEPAEILLALILLAGQVSKGLARVENAYPGVVSWGAACAEM